MTEKLEVFINRALAEGWAIDKIVRMVNRDLDEGEQPANEREVTDALGELGYRVGGSGIRAIGECAFSEGTRAELLKLATGGVHSDELFEVEGAEVDDPIAFIEANGYALDDDDRCIAVKTTKATTPAVDVRAKKQAKLAEDGLPRAITVRLAGQDIRRVPGYPKVCVTADQIAFVREHSRRLGDHIRLLPRKRDPRTGRESWVLGMGARHKRVYLNVSKVMYNCGFWCPVPKDKRRKQVTR
jgi:hypothetical protein